MASAGTAKRPADVTVKHGIGFELRCPASIRAEVSNDRPLLLLARQSPKRTTKVARAVARDAKEMVAGLGKEMGIWIEEHLPSPGVLTDLLMATKDITESILFEDRSKRFKNWFAVLDLRPQGIPIVILLSCGPATMLNEHRQQPFILRVAEMVAELQPVLLFSKTSARSFRQTWPQAPLRIEIEAANKRGNTIIEASMEGQDAGGEFADLDAMLKGKANLKAAQATTATTRTTMRTLTGDEPKMMGGGFNFHFGTGIPPGLTRVVLRKTGAAGRIRRVVLDSPSAYPKQREVFSSLPAVLDEHGEPADQVENVRWFLKHLGKDKWPLARLQAKLERRGLSSDGLRSRYGPDAKSGMVINRRTIGTPFTRSHPLIAALPIYETGVWTFTYADEPVKITNIFPLDGPWGSDEDFERIRAWLETRQTAVDSRVFRTFAGQPVTINGTPAILRARVQPPENEFLVRYHFALPKAEDGDAVPKPNRNFHTLPHEWIAESIVESVADSSRSPLLPPPQTEPSSEIDSLGRKLHSLDALIAATQSRAQALYNASLELNEDGTFVAPRQTRSKFMDDHEGHMVELQKLAADREQLEAEISEARTRYDRVRRGLEVASLIDVLTSLRNPQSVDYHDMWRDSISEFVVTQTPFTSHGRDGEHIEWTFKLRLSDPDHMGDVVVRGERKVGRATKVDQAIDLLIARLRAGIPVERRHNEDRRLLAAARERLHLPAAAPQLTCRHPELLRLHMQVIEAINEGVARRSLVHDARFDTPELTRTFGRPQRLVQRILELFHDVEATGHYRRAVGRNERRALLIASRSAGVVDRAVLGKDSFRDLSRELIKNGSGPQWDITPGRLTLQPCRHCGASEQAAPYLREMFGYVCLECRLDAEGIRWDESFNSGLAAAPLGPEPPRPSPPEELERPSRSSQRTARHMSDLEDVEYAELLGAYRDGSSISQVAEQFGMSYTHVRQHLKKLGLSRPRGPRPRSEIAAARLRDTHWGELESGDEQNSIST